MHYKKFFFKNKNERHQSLAWSIRNSSHRYVDRQQSREKARGAHGRKCDYACLDVFDKYILKIAYEELPITRTRIYSYKHFLKYFKLMLNDINSWR